MPHFWVGREFPPANGLAYMVYALALMCSRELYENHADFNAIKIAHSTWNKDGDLFEGTDAGSCIMLAENEPGLGSEEIGD
ncbi:MAG: hypothetical protein LQ349_008106 [Xanthoria aureola]|nr:MAG: hypothetical protein LQ349_008106 [Xanthoria aureola]